MYSWLVRRILSAQIRRLNAADPTLVKGFSKDANPASRQSLFNGIEWNCPGFDPDAFASSPAPAAGESALAQSEPAKSSAR